jgi:hypothetical protein
VESALIRPFRPNQIKILSFQRKERILSAERFVPENAKVLNFGIFWAINISRRMFIRVEIFIVQTFNDVPVYVVSMV